MLCTGDKVFHGIKNSMPNASFMNLWRLIQNKGHKEIHDNWIEFTYCSFDLMLAVATHGFCPSNNSTKAIVWLSVPPVTTLTVQKNHFQFVELIQIVVASV